MTEFMHLMTPAERHRLASQVRPLLQQPELSEQRDYDGVKTTLNYHPAKAHGHKRRRKQVAQEFPSIECEADGLGLSCELVMAKGRIKVRVRSSGYRFAALVVSSGSDGSRHFSVAVVEPSSKNLDVVLEEEAEIAIVGIKPDAFLNSLSEVAEMANVRYSDTSTPISDVPCRRRPRSRAATSLWHFSDLLTLKGFVLRALTLLSLYVAYCRLVDGWQRIGDMLQCYNGRLPPSFGSRSGLQYSVDMAKLLRRRHEFRFDDATHQELVASREFVDAILVTVFVDIPKLCFSTYVVVTLVIRGGTGPFYRTLWCEAMHLAVDEYTYFASNQIASVAYMMTYFASIDDLLRNALNVFYMCLLRWNPADRTHTLRYLIRSLASSILVSIFLTVLVWSPFLIRYDEPRLSDIDKYAKRLPELSPSDMRDIPFVTA